MTSTPSHSSRRRVGFKTLGCKLNQAETESIAAGFRSLGWEIAHWGEEADAVVVNSCTVTNLADRKSRSAMNQALRISPVAGSSSDKPLVIMTGCYVDAQRDVLEADGRTYVVGNAHKSYIPQLVDAHFKGEVIPGNLEASPFGYTKVERIFRTRAMVKIQDGCDNFCSFCIIPFVRGRGISRSLVDTVEAVKAAVAAGYREIVLTGVNMSRWTEGKKNFISLVDAVLQVKGNFRLRMGSIEPERLGNGLLDVMSHPKMTPHMHLCVQSGSEKTLLAMRRQYTAEKFERIAQELHEHVPHFNLTTDVIVGFPGESEHDFADTVKICQRIAFGHIHTFPYSLRDGTRAERMGPHVSAAIKRERAQVIRDISEQTKRRFRSSLIGTVQEVLVENVHRLPDGRLHARGLSANYVPVRFQLPQSQKIENTHNHIFPVQISAIEKSENPDLIAVCNELQ